MNIVGKVISNTVLFYSFYLGIATTHEALNIKICVGEVWKKVRENFKK